MCLVADLAATANALSALMIVFLTAYRAMCLLLFYLMATSCDVE